MSHWNHRVIKRKFENGDELFGIHEVFYNDDNSIWSYTTEPIEVVGESIDSLRQTLEWMLKSLDTPLLVDGEFEYTEKDENMSTLFQVYGGEKGYIPAYASKKAPGGDWAKDKNGNQLMVPNGRLLFALGSEVNDNNYSKYEIAEGTYSGLDVWLENSHVRLYEPDKPEPKGCLSVIRDWLKGLWGD